MLCAKLLKLRRFASQVNKTIAEAESHMLVDPHFFEKKDIISKIQHWMTNNEALRDMERSFKDFKRKQCDSKYLWVYNSLVDAIQKEDYSKLQVSLSSTLFKQIKKSIKDREQLPYYFVKATECKLVQARSYSQSLIKTTSTNKWYQLTFQYKFADGDLGYHVLERNDKLKHFKFIKFYL